MRVMAADDWACQVQSGRRDMNQQKYHFVPWVVIPSLVIRSNSAQFDAWFANLLLRGN